MIKPYAAVEVDSLEKTFRVPKHHIHTLKERALRPFRRTEYEELHVLRGVSFEIAAGEFFGVVGRNGSGKSTLLKCLASIYRADTGSIRIAGRLAPFIELGVGFNPNLPALENVILNGVMMGLTPRQAKDRFDDVIAFAELEDFLDLELKNYSSGMQVRLAFSVMVQADADVLLIDEVLAVGDTAFQEKCFEVFRSLRDDGKTIVLVTHDMAMIDRFCHRALLLRDGLVETIGDPHHVSDRYLEINFDHIEAQKGQRRQSGRDATLVDAWVETEDGRRTDSVEAGHPLTLHAVVKARTRIEEPHLHLSLETLTGTRLFASGTQELGPADAALEPGEQVHLRLYVDNVLAPGRYFVGCWITRGEARSELALHEPHAANFHVGGDMPGDAGLLVLEHELAVERAVERAPQ
jgi:ABC-type polysaccharide/polyol phosphate transport system ATPase subunit